ncbi:harpin-induced protein 1 domain containing protein [Musa troglodytarum]|uniref:Harpin-induced protein 1 domain containing protein n=1 Tax=Musa troglodytarum TaxID=320322 RepID=A0A9E7KYQ0_9LILI|nr:harpin-induced protein 1 domain containing protein [Musa troglodytarum]
MASAKQGHLNGAYYGPPVPPPQSYHSVGSRSSCGPCSLLCTLFKFIISIVIIVGIVALVLWLVFRPHEVKVYVGTASLAQFAFSSNSSNLQYNLSMDMSIRNPNKRISIYYDYVEARALYDGSRFAFDVLPTFYQGHKNTTVLYPAFQGTQLLLGDSVATTYSREKEEGFYYVHVKLYTRLRLKVWVLKIHYNKQKVDCSLKLPVPGSSAKFEGTKCDVDLF